MEIVIHGPPGSGKSTLADHLADRIGVPVISSGNIARALAEKDASVRVGLAQGLDGPEEAVRSGVREQLETAQIHTGGWVLDGFPRRLDQLICLMQWLQKDVEPIHFWLQCPKLICIERLVLRNRTDDTADGIARRLESYEEKTVPMIQLLNEAGRVVPLDYAAGGVIEDSVVQAYSYLSR